MILIVSATNRPGSNTRIISGMYEKWLSDRNVSYDLLDLSDLPPDFLFTALFDKSGTHQQFNLFQEKIDVAEKLLFVVPEYNGSFPGILKGFFDGLSYPGTFDGKKAAFTGLSSGPLGGIVAISHLTDIMHYYNVTVLPVTPRIPFVDSNLDKTIPAVNDEAITALMKEKVEALIRF